MLSFFKENTRFVLLLILVVGALFIINRHNTDKPNDTPPPSPPIDSTEPSLSGYLTRQKRLDHITWIYAHGKQYPQESLTKDSTKDYVITHYEPNYFDNNIPLKEQGGGVLLFKIENNIPKLIWETNDNIGGNLPSVWVMDVTGDNQKEILIQQGDGKGDVLLIYTSNGKTFKLISPEQQRGLNYGSKSYSPVFNAKDGAIDVADLDGDSIPEVSFPTSYLGNGQFADEEHYVAYKWDGTKYFLWKEHKEPFIK